VPRLADWVAIDIVGDDGALRRVAVAHVDASKVTWLAELERRYPARAAARGGVPGVVRTGRSELAREVTDAMLVAGARDAEHLELIRAIGLRSYLCVPLTTRGRIIGALTFATAETRRLYGPDDLAFAEEVARRAAVAIDNARLHTETEAAERRFRALAAAIPQIVWVMEPDGAHEYLSPRWFEYTGQTPDVPPEERWARAIHPEDIEACFQRWAHAKETGDAWQVEYRLRRADGAYRWHLGRSVPVTEGGALKWYGTATDIDEQRRAIRARDDILATVSHDLRSPLGAIRFASTLLREGEDAPDLLLRIERSADRMETLIKDLLDITAIESGQLSMSWEPRQASALVAEAVSQHLPLALAKGVGLTVAPDVEDVTLPCDGARVLQVLANLIGNALKFTPASGAITVGYGVAGAFARFSVADSGPGIPPSRRKRVFERFWRDQASAGAGTGLGLAISKGIIEQHGGAIAVEGAEGEGATFVFTLPLTHRA
jgi:PAS domain S-box-containing protein